MNEGRTLIMATKSNGDSVSKVVTLVKSGSYNLSKMRFKRGEPQLVTDAAVLKRVEAINTTVGTKVFTIEEPKRTPVKKTESA
jgi:hypothetical protein